MVVMGPAPHLAWEGRLRRSRWPCVTDGPGVSPQLWLGTVWYLNKPVFGGRLLTLLRSGTSLTRPQQRITYFGLVQIRLIHPMFMPVALYICIVFPYGGFLSHRRVPPVIIHFRLGFPVWTICFGLPPFTETPISCCWFHSWRPYHDNRKQHAFAALVQVAVSSGYVQGLLMDIFLGSAIT